jgi:WD40 repeat protein
MKGVDMLRFKSLFRFLAVWFGIIAILSISSASTFASEKLAPAGSKQGPEIFVQLAHKSVISTLAISPDGKYLASADTNVGGKNIKIWDMLSGREFRTIIVEINEGIRYLRFSVDAKQIFAVTSTKIYVFDVYNGNNLKIIDIGHLPNIHDDFWVRERIDGIFSDYGFSVSKQIVLRTYDSGRETERIVDNFIYTLLRKEEKKYDFILEVRRMSDRVKVRQIELNSLTFFVLTFENVIFTPDLKHLVAAHGDGTISIRELKTGQKVMELGKVKPTGFMGLSYPFSLGNRFLYNLNFADKESQIVWDIKSGRLLYYIQKGETVPEEYSSFIKKNFVATKDGKIKLSSTFASESSDQKYKAVVNWNDKTIRLFENSTGKEIAQFISFTDGEWIVITPEGYFNASPNGAKHLNVRVGNKVYSIDNFYEKFFNPVYVASVLQGKKVEAVADIRRGILTPPDVRITSPAPGSQFSTDTLTVTVAAKDTGGGIDGIRLYHNGKAIGEDQRGLKLVSKGGETVKDYTVTLVDGVNTFRAVGFSKDRTESNPYELVVKLTAPSKDVSLYVFAVGINKYKNPALNLNYAEPDARGITDFFKRQGKRLFKNVDIRVIYNEQATKENIVSELSQLQNINPQDVVLIYLAGHGDNVNEKWYFIPHELTYPEREEDVKTKGISSDELSGYMKNIKAQKILVLIDACKSGAVLVAFRGFEDRKALSQLSRSTGVHIIAASTKDQFAAEVKDLGHGVFTYTLLEGLRGKAAGGGETVTVFKLKAYLDEQLPEITKKYKQEAQYPVGDTRGMDFPLVIVK